MDDSNSLERINKMKIPEENWTDLDLPDPPIRENFESDEEYMKQLWHWQIELLFMNWVYTHKFRKLVILFGLLIGPINVIIAIIYTIHKFL